jgi:hypothetical protein
MHYNAVIILNSGVSGVCSRGPSRLLNLYEQRYSGGIRRRIRTNETE